MDPTVDKPTVDECLFDEINEIFIPFCDGVECRLEASALVASSKVVPCEPIPVEKLEQLRQEFPENIAARSDRPGDCEREADQYQQARLC